MLPVRPIGHAPMSCWALRMLIVPLLLLLLLMVRGSWQQEACSSKIFCQGPILETVQEARLFMDPKRFVDMPTRFNASTVMERFDQLGGNYSAPALNAFLEENFHRAGHEVRIVIPPDWKRSISMLSEIKDSKLRDFAGEVHAKWKSLVRKVDKSLICPDCESTAIDLPFPFLVPGGRFREYYYWDTFWILEGVYASEMCLTAKGVVRNTLWMAKTFGFVPNGSRSYFLNRSQPPMLPMMIERYVQECGASDAFIEGALEVLETEYDFWMGKRSVIVMDKGGQAHVLNRYSAGMDVPRPESYAHDLDLSSNIRNLTGRRCLYHDLASACESGWDFSGRWFNWTNGTVGLEGTVTSSIVPVDLNSQLYQNELAISRLCARVGNHKKSTLFEGYAEARATAIHRVLYQEDLRMWKDWNIIEGAPSLSRPFYITDLCPLWYGPYKSITTSAAARMLEEHRQIIYGYPGGVPISETDTGQQWDLPNAWAPTQYLLVKLHLRLSNETGDQLYHHLAVGIAQRWIDTTYCGYKHYGYMFEKYDAKVVGQPGGGGEYVVQEGFGWTNGVILWMLQTLGPHLKAPTCPNLPTSSAVVEPVTLEFALSVFIWVMTLLLSSTYLIVLCAKLRQRHAPLHGQPAEEPLLFP